MEGASVSTRHALEALRDLLAARGVEVDDNFGRPARVPVRQRRARQYALDGLDQFLLEAARHRLLTPAEEIALAKRIERGDLAAKEHLITHDLRLVVSIARRFQRRS